MANPRPRLSRLFRQLRLIQTRHQSSTTTTARPQQHDPYTLLSQPTWSIRTLLPPPPSSPAKESEKEEENEIKAAQLTHLLRLSALPQPTTPSQTSNMLATLHAQLRFVRDIQRVHTDGVAPLSSIRDETHAGLREAAVTTATLRAALAEEEVFGRCRRPRRRRRQDNIKRDNSSGGGKGGRPGVEEEKEAEDCDVLGAAGERVGRYFVVRSSGSGSGSGLNGKANGGGGSKGEGVKGAE
ncbi:hypothetical protein C8A00DRAFT_33078 [Chaetomidium leptoderma]|uniref:Glutamyl-tRNA amidotransferase complex subunit Gta3 domain-containing protein n=1 Tax=Chaetomidium leptoderma TaxID=669021 RepID=A0AAN6VPQ3_9PEZI|nr:hypothetical protein C8A00DRAFT_33078 [Chaetomidium leptoderma]